MEEPEFLKWHPNIEKKEIYYDSGCKVIFMSVIDDTQLDKQKVKEVISKHTIKNADGEDYIACPPSVLLKELSL